MAINQLPPTADTLWLRILGKGRTQQQAIEELLACPEEHTHRVLELLAIWRINMKLKEHLTTDEQELIMNLTPAYQQWRDHTWQQGRQQGLAQGSQQGHLEERRELITHILQSRFGELEEAWLPVIVSLVQLSPQELSPILLHSSREELLAQFGQD